MLGWYLPRLHVLPQVSSQEISHWAETHLITPICGIISPSELSSWGLRHLHSGFTALADPESSWGRAGRSPAAQAAKPLANERVIIMV